MIGRMKGFIDITDGMILAGSGLLFYGIYQIFPPAAYIILGIGLIFWAIQIERGKPNGQNR
jgi:hypothetical protein